MQQDDQQRDPYSAEGGDDPPPASRIEENVKSRSTWLRLVFMIVFGFLYAITRILVFAVVVLQFLWLLFTGEPNPRLTAAGQSLATYTYQLVRYLTFNSDDRPFPFDDDWPDATPL